MQVTNEIALRNRIHYLWIASKHVSIQTFLIVFRHYQLMKVIVDQQCTCKGNHAVFSRIWRFTLYYRTLLNYSFTQFSVCILARHRMPRNFQYKTQYKTQSWNSSFFAMENWGPWSWMAAEITAEFRRYNQSTYSFYSLLLLVYGCKNLLYYIPNAQCWGFLIFIHLFLMINMHEFFQTAFYSLDSTIHSLILIQMDQVNRIHSEPGLLLTEHFHLEYSIHSQSLICILLSFLEHRPTIVQDLWSDRNILLKFNFFLYLYSKPGDY